MTIVFLICVAIGVPIVLFQFVMTLIGLGMEAFDVDVPHDVGHDLGGVDHDLSGDVDHDLGGVEHDLSGDVQADGDVSPDFHGEAALHDFHHGDAAAHHGSTWFFRIISFRTVVAAIAFFGIGGLAAQAAQLSEFQALVIALAAGGSAMYGVYWLMRGLYMLKSEGTVKVQRAVGRPATVYLRIPGHNSGTGKIQINLQNRTCEYLAQTPGEAIPTGRTVVVTNILSPETVEVMPAADTAAHGPTAVAG